MGGRRRKWWKIYQYFVSKTGLLLHCKNWHYHLQIIKRHICAFYNVWKLNVLHESMKKYAFPEFFFWTNSISFLPALEGWPQCRGSLFAQPCLSCVSLYGQSPKDLKILCVQHWVRFKARAEGSPAHLTACGTARCQCAHSRVMQITHVHWAAHMDSLFWGCWNWGSGSFLWSKGQKISLTSCSGLWCHHTDWPWTDKRIKVTDEGIADPLSG